MTICSFLCASCGCQGAEIPKEFAEERFYLMGNLSPSDSQMMGIVIQTKTKTIVIDGGTMSHANQLYEFLREKANLHVDAWFFTHPHQDHIGAFYQLCNEFSVYDGLQVDNIYYNFPSIEDIDEYGYRSASEYRLQKATYELLESKYTDRTHYIQKGQEIFFDGLKFTILRVYNQELKANFVNNSSAVFRIDSAEKSFLILGDLGAEGGEELMDTCSLSDLQTDYTQMSHHGQSGCSKEFYEYIHPKACIWPTPEWLWNNNSGVGFNTGSWQTVQTREWMQKLGVTEHYVAKDGVQSIKL